MLDQLREMDTVVVWKLDRLSRSLKDVLHIMERIAQAGAGFRSITENIDTTTPAGRMMMQMVASFAEFERAMIRERTSAGLAAARACIRSADLGAGSESLGGASQSECGTMSRRRDIGCARNTSVSRPAAGSSPDGSTAARFRPRRYLLPRVRSGGDARPATRRDDARAAEHHLAALFRMRFARRRDRVDRGSGITPRICPGANGRARSSARGSNGCTCTQVRPCRHLLSRMRGVDVLVLQRGVMTPARLRSISPRCSECNSSDVEVVVIETVGRR